MSPPTTGFELLLYVAEDPVRFLGVKSVDRFRAFSLGFWAGSPRGSFIEGGPDRSADFEKFVSQRFQVPGRWPMHQHARNYVDFLGVDDADGFDLYVQVYKDFYVEHPPKLREMPTGEAEPGDRPALHQLLEAICERPGMYFLGSDRMCSLVTLLNGCIEAERMHTGASPTASLLENFQAWMNARHPWSLGRPWHRILLFQNLYNDDRALSAFWTYFNLCINDAPPDAMTPVGQHAFDTNPGLEDMSEEQRKAHQRMLNQIFYTE